MEDTKKCSVCEEVKPLADFYFIKNRNRHMHYCSKCNADKIRAYRKKSGKYQQYHSAYQQTDKYKQISKDYKQSDRGKAKHCEQQKVYRDRLKCEIIHHYSNGTMKCARCDFSDMKALSIDHINGNGAEHRRELGTASKLYQWLRCNEYPEGFQVLCMNCQFVKKHDNCEVKRKVTA